MGYDEQMRPQGQELWVNENKKRKEGQLTLKKRTIKKRRTIDIE